MCKINLKRHLLLLMVLLGLGHALNAADLEFSDDELLNTRPEQASTDKQQEKTQQQINPIQQIIDDTKYSKKQATTVALAFIATLACNGLIKGNNLMPQIANKIENFADIKEFTPKILEQYKDTIQVFVTPIIPTATILSLLWLASKTESETGISFEKNEKTVLVAVTYLFSLLCMQNLKTNPPTDTGKTTKWQQFFSLLKTSGNLIALSAIPTILIHNLFTKYNAKQALKRFLDNYNPDKDKFGQAYSDQLEQIEQGKQVSDDEKITIANNKLFTPKRFHKFFDEIYSQYEYEGESILGQASQQMLVEFKKIKLLLN